MANIHGEYQKFQSILSQISFRDTDNLYILGDLLDFGDGSMELIEDISMRINVFPIVGEHDFLAAQMLAGFSRMLESGAAPDAEFSAQMMEWVQNGGQSTLAAFRALDKEARTGVLEYLEDMTLFEEITVRDKEYVLVHAGIADYEPDADLYDYEPEDFFSEPLSPDFALIEGKTVIVGHTPTKSGKIERG
jgi:serine/threonine protein phosphatase 1